MNARQVSLLPATAPVARIGDRLLHAGILHRAQLEEAAALQRRTGTRIGRCLLSLGYLSEEQLGAVLATQLELPFWTPSVDDLDPTVVRLVPEALARRHGVLPLATGPSGTVVGMTDPTDLAALAEVAAALDGRAAAELLPVVITERAFDAALERIYSEEHLRQSVSDLNTRAPDDSAAVVLSRGQKRVAALAGVLILGALCWHVWFTLSAAITVITGVYIVCAVYKLSLVVSSLSSVHELAVSPEDLAGMDEHDLPIYSIIVPLYRELAIVPVMLDALAHLDYPRTKLDIILVLEEDDRDLVAYLRARELPHGVRIVVVPDSRPKGKPKACNYGLIQARGEFVVIYDAEDVPEPDQLKKVVHVFRHSDATVSTVQAKLNYYNRRRNLLTQWFTAEYSAWFDLILPGLSKANAPVPLGGTSNHFRTDTLRAIGGWDPYNVTEDADLGVRLFKRGFRTVIVDSTTYEEASWQLANWVRQRSRWIKGYMQTWLVHMRHPVALWRSTGLLPFLSFNITIGGSVLTFLLNPLLWGLTVLWYTVHPAVIEHVYPAPVFYVGLLSLYVGNFLFMYICLLGAVRREYHEISAATLLVPLYWLLMSVAAWKAVYQLVRRPFYWEKTDHGVTSR